MHIAHRITVAAPSHAIFRIYEDVAHWPAWDPDTRQASLDGPFRVGSRSRLTPTRGHAVTMVLTQVVPDRGFTVECRIPLFCMVFEHELTPIAGGTEVLHRASVAGPLAFLLWRLLCRQLNGGLPVTLARLKARAEAAAAG